MAGKLDSIMSRMNTDVKASTVLPVQTKQYSVFDLVQKEQYVGEVLSLNYSSAVLQVHEAYRKKVGGIPAQCFLIATRINPEDYQSFDALTDDSLEEDCSLILLRVLDSASLPDDLEKMRILSDNASNVPGAGMHWDQKMKDAQTKKIMQIGGLSCRVVGTFYMDKDSNQFELKFGNDLSNFYPNRALKVYKPSEEALASIVNFNIDMKNSVKLGKVRYSSTNRTAQGVADVEVRIDPRDLVAQKTAVFGMTRTGKSNTVKMIAKTIYQLRQKANKRIGQLIFDPNGEYANNNLQDIDDATGEAQALKNVWKVPVNGIMGKDDDVRIYGLMPNANDPERRIMKINFYDDSLLQTGKELIDDKLSSDSINNVQYIKSFTSVRFESVRDMTYGEQTREKRRRLVYKTLLSQSGFKAPYADKVAKEPGLFNEDLIEALEIGIKDFDMLSENRQRDLTKNVNNYKDGAIILRRLATEGTTYSELARAFTFLEQYIEDPESTFNDFERKYLNKSETGSAWLDVYLSNLLKMFQYKNAMKKLEKASIYHDPKSSQKDYAHMIYEDLSSGRLVIVDQALGDSDLNQIAAERILRTIFEENNKVFSNAQKPSEILIYIEEAHNLMPKGSEEDTTNIWARVAKEGAKFNIGMIYSTQEVSSIQKNILKNTTNWFISHLNNREEIRALSDFYDFEDFAQSILQAEDKGFIRMKTRSNKFVVPIQVDKFQVSNKNET